MNHRSWTMDYRLWTIDHGLSIRDYRQFKQFCHYEKNIYFCSAPATFALSLSMPLQKTTESIFSQLETFGHKKIVFCSDPDSGLKAIIAIHDTTLGPALGGTRMWAYKTEADALNDVLRLSKAMTYKAAVSGLNLGGGKAVIIGDSHKDKTEALLRKIRALY
jgi:glutamate dehydrogenase/leucine dehydrogenase